MNTRKFIALTIAAAMAVSTLPAAMADSVFPDVNEGEWYV